MHYLLFYDVADDYVERRQAFRAAHLDHARAAIARGELVLGGALADPVDGAVLLFRASSPALAEAFAARDPYVTNGLVRSWRVREWTTVVGPSAEVRLADTASERKAGARVVPVDAARFVGTWRLVHWFARLPDGRRIVPFGPDFRGRITYDGDGRMAVQVMKIGRPLFADADPLGGTSEEITAALRGFIAYYGAYTVDVAAGVIRHTVEVCSFPNWVGTVQDRFFRFVEDELELSSGPIESSAWEGEARHVLRWQRA